MRLLLIPSLVTVACSTALAQGTNRTTEPTNADVVNRALARGKGNVDINVTGSQFLLPYWTRGNVKMPSGAVPRPWLKYDLAGERLLWRRPTGDSLQLNTDQMTEFSLRDSLRGKTYTYRRYLTARIAPLPLRTAFFEVLYDAGHSALLRRCTRVLFHGSNGPSLESHPESKWMETNVFYLKHGDNIIDPVRLKEKSVLTTLGSEKEPALSAYTFREHLNLSKEADVIKLLQYYDTL